MKILIALLALAALAAALERHFDPPQPSVLVDVPDPSAPPADDLNLNGADNV